jgi:hypothetical protein
MLAYNIQYHLNPNMAIQLSAYAKYGFSQIDNKDTITATFKGSNLVAGNFCIVDQHYCRGNQLYSYSEPLRDPKSNNIAAGLQLSFIYTFGNNKRNY